MSFIPKSKIFALFAVVGLYVVLGMVFMGSVHMGFVERLPPTPAPAIGIDSAEYVYMEAIPEQLGATQRFTDEKIIRPDGHVNLYAGILEEGQDDTNSEAMSYALLWHAQAGEKEAFDIGLKYIEEHMIHPELGFLMWRLNSEGIAEKDGMNLASDADLRAIGALIIAEQRWGDAHYSEMIDSLAIALEKYAITEQNLFAPYAGGTAENPWMANEIWISYEDFNVFRALATRRGEPWLSVYEEMKKVTLEAQIKNGLYNSEITFSGDFGNAIDGDGFGINSMWIMTRSAESSDSDLRAAAQKSLEFYKSKFQIDAQLYSLYSANGDALAGYDTPWVYALVGRAAVALNDEAFADAMLWKLLQFQDQDSDSVFYGAILEAGVDNRAGQFVMQESILTMQDYVVMKEGFD